MGDKYSRGKMRKGKVCGMGWWWGNCRLPFKSEFQRKPHWEVMVEQQTGEVEGVASGCGGGTFQVRRWGASRCTCPETGVWTACSQKALRSARQGSKPGDVYWDWEDERTGWEGRVYFRNCNLKCLLNIQGEMLRRYTGRWKSQERCLGDI